MFDPVSPLPAIASLFFAGFTAHILACKFGPPSEEGRFVAIDGLRGYLAFFVFLHHSCIWYFFLKTGRWEVPPSNLYTNFGQGSVAFFFMITGFLFFTKILNDRVKGTDWIKLYVSRALRLVPLYFFTMMLLFLMVAVLSHGSLNESPSQLILNTVKWLSFTIFQTSNLDLNGVKNTFVIVAGVAWSLPYEWFFYLSLPLLALVVGNIPPMKFLALGILGIVGFAKIYSIPWHLLSFAGGIFAALIVRFEWFRKFSSKRAFSFFLMSSLGLAFTFFPSSYAPIPFLLISLSFALIAGGNTMFGVLSSRVSLTLGEMAYSIYLLQGPMLFVLFNFLIGWRRAELLPASVHWLLVILMTPVLVSICFLTFHFIERPAMQSAETVTNRIRSALRRSGTRDQTMLSNEKNNRHSL